MIVAGAVILALLLTVAVVVAIATMAAMTVDEWRHGGRLTAVGMAMFQLLLVGALLVFGGLMIESLS